MKILVGCPCVVDGGQLRRLIQGIIYKSDVSLIVVDNSVGIDKSVSAVLLEYSDRVYVIQNPENEFVNPSWSKIMKYFLDHGEYDYLILVNSDLTLQRDWDFVCKKRWLLYPDEILIPTVAEPREVDVEVLEVQEVFESTAGIFITMNRKQCELAYPLPGECLVWFGDEYYYTIMRAIGYKTVVVPNLLVEHEESSSIRQVNGVQDIIAQDKINWEATGRKKMKERINTILEQNNKPFGIGDGFQMNSETGTIEKFMDLFVWETKFVGLEKQQYVGVHYDFYIQGEDGTPLAYRIKGKEIVIIDGAKAIESCIANLYMVKNGTIANKINLEANTEKI